MVEDKKLNRHVKIPSEVFWVWCIQSNKEPVGVVMCNKMQEVISRNPKFFTWEHKYKKVPKVVHDAFREEYMNMFHKKKPISKNINKGGLASLINENTVTHYEKVEHNNLLNTHKEHFDFFKERESKEKSRVDLIKNIWEKHYKEYDLEYRGFIP